ncbi:MAG TPA: sugar transferase [Paludibacter sp.]|nr:sugar transferase [Paludibacter sp.]
MDKRRLVLKYLLFDLLASLIVWVLFMLFRKIVNDGLIFDGLRILIPNYNFFSSLSIFPVSCVFVHYLSGFYLQPHKQSTLTSILTTLAASAIISITIFFVLMLDDVVVSYEYYYYSLLVLFGLLFSITYGFRAFVSSQVSYNYRTKKWTSNTLIIGTGTNALKIANELEKNAVQSTLMGFVSVNQQILVPQDKVLGTMNQIAAIIEKKNIQEAIVVLDNADEQQLFTIINSLYKFNIEIRFTPRLYEILTGSAKINRLEISPFVSITNSSMPDWEASVKRFSDILLSTIALVILSPFLLYFMFRIKRDSKGPVFYRQERIGRYGKPFDILKFRTMYLGSENGIPKLSSANDNRITPVGKILRKYRIDEIPQFWNIIKGDMSLVGPRPERRYYINRIIEDAPYYCLLYKIRPGLTSWGPIKIGYSDSIEKMIERLNYDIIYLDNMSLLTDMKILIYTFEIIFKGKGV